MLRKNIFAAFTLITGGLLVVTTSCSEQSPGWEYMPDMYRSPAVEAYQPNSWFADSMGARKPVEGTISRGFMSYDSYANTNEGYEAAKAGMLMPAGIKRDSVTLAEGAKLYGIFCSHCHGEKGDGNGILMQREKFLGIPSYADREITPGSVFHVITYGKNLMGSHASQVTPEERWEITQHVMKLRQELVGGGSEEAAAESEDATAVADSTAASSETNDNKQS